MLPGFKRWLRFIFRGHNQALADRLKIAALESSLQLARAQFSAAQQPQGFLDEKTFMDFEKHVHQELAEIREKLDTKARRAPSGRPFTALRTIAEAGEARRRNG